MVLIFLACEIYATSFGQAKEYYRVYCGNIARNLFMLVFVRLRRRLCRSVSHELVRTRLGAHIWLP